MTRKLSTKRRARFAKTDEFIPNQQEWDEAFASTDFTREMPSPTTSQTPPRKDHYISDSPPLSDYSDTQSDMDQISSPESMEVDDIRPNYTSEMKGKRISRSLNDLDRRHCRTLPTLVRHDSDDDGFYNEEQFQSTQDQRPHQKTQSTTDLQQFQDNQQYGKRFLCARPIPTLEVSDDVEGNKRRQTSLEAFFTSSKRGLPSKNVILAERDQFQPDPIPSAPPQPPEVHHPPQANLAQNAHAAATETTPEQAAPTPTPSRPHSPIRYPGHSSNELTAAATPQSRKTMAKTINDHSSVTNVKTRTGGNPSPKERPLLHKQRPNYHAANSKPQAAATSTPFVAPATATLPAAQLPSQTQPPPPPLTQKPKKAQFSYSKPPTLEKHPKPGASTKPGPYPEKSIVDKVIGRLRKTPTVNKHGLPIVSQSPIGKPDVVMRDNSTK
jgi:hypothetical protein